MTDEIKALKIMTSDMAQAKYMIEMATLRDQFAMAALTALATGSSDAAAMYAARSAYIFADAMLKARKEKKDD